MSWFKKFLSSQRGGLRVSLAVAAAIAVTGIGVLVANPFSSSADGGDFQLDFIAAADDDYDHLTTPANEVAPGGLQYDSRAINTHVVEQLEAEDFACGDTIVFFTEVTTNAGASGTQSIEITYDFDAINNGQKGVGYSQVVATGISNLDFAGQTAETGNQNLDGNESVSLVSQTFSPGGGAPPTGFGTSDAKNLIAKVRVDGLDAADVLIVRIDVRFSCFAAPVTGNLHAALQSAAVIGTGRGLTINVGQQDIPMLGLGEIATTTPTTPTSVASSTPRSTTTPDTTVTPEP